MGRSPGDAVKQSISAKNDRRLINSAKAAYQNLKSPEMAIARRCIECAYDPQDAGSVMEQIARCEKRTCSLYSYRPKSNGQTALTIKPNMADSSELQYKAKLVGKNHITPKSAIAGYCIDCIFDAHETGNWRDQVRNCTSRDCDLYRVRSR
jgi:hypothetical protein